MVTGPVDRWTGAQYILAAGHALEHSVEVSIDLGGVQSYDGMGLAAFIAVQNMAHADGRHVVLTNLHPNVGAKLRRAGLLSFFTAPPPP